MKNHQLIINENDILYDILSEIKDELNFSILKFVKKDLKTIETTKDLNYFFLTSKEIPGIKNQILLDKFPFSLFKLIERLNIEVLKLNFNEQSDIKIGNYIFNINSREMKNNYQNLKLTEKEINSIIYIFSSQIPVKVQELQSRVWGYNSGIETHTVETHIYRLRKKIFNKFNDNFFIRTSNEGYQIK